MPFGKHKGKPVGTIPKGYLKWVLRTCDIEYDLAKAIAKVLGLPPDKELKTY